MGKSLSFGGGSRLYFIRGVKGSPELLCSFRPLLSSARYLAEDGKGAVPTVCGPENFPKTPFRGTIHRTAPYAGIYFC